MGKRGEDQNFLILEEDLIANDETDLKEIE